MSHAHQLGSLGEATTRRIIDELAELHIPMAAAAPSVPAQPPRTAVAQDGLRLGLGEHGQHDYASPYDNTDMLDRTWQLAFTNDFRRDELVEHCHATTAIGAAAVLDPTARRLRGTADRPGLEVDVPAELLVVDGETLVSAAMDRGADRAVLHRGRVVAEGPELLSTP